MKKLTITLADEVDAALRRTFGQREVIGYLDALVKPWLLQGTLEAGYAAMAADEERERDALEWREGLIGDADTARALG